MRANEGDRAPAVPETSSETSSPVGGNRGIHWLHCAHPLPHGDCSDA